MELKKTKIKCYTIQINKMWFKDLFSKKQRNLQQQTVDQNFANGTLFMTLSTLESLHILAESNGSVIKSQKIFGAYDQYDYSKKSYQELLLQTINQVMLLAASRKDMMRTHNQYRLPQNYNLQKVFKTLSVYQNSFKKRNMIECEKLADDVGKILEGKTDNLSYISILTEIRPKLNCQKVNMKQFANNLIKQSDRIQKDQCKMADRKLDSLQFIQNKGIRQCIKNQENQIKDIEKHLNSYQNYYKKLIQIQQPQIMLKEMNNHPLSQIIKIYDERIQYINQTTNDSNLLKKYEQSKQNLNNRMKKIKQLGNSSQIKESFKYFKASIKLMVQPLKYEMQQQEYVTVK